MSAVGARAAQAQSGIADLESALEKTQKALSTVEKVDAVATAKKSRKLLKMLLIVTVVGVAVIMAKKMMGGSSPQDGADPYGSKSSES